MRCQEKKTDFGLIVLSVHEDLGDGLLICTLISENQGLEKSRSASNLRKISGPAELNSFSVHLNFFSVCHLNFFQIYTINLKKSRWQTEKKLRCTEKKFRCAGPEIFLRFETDLDFSRPRFLEIKVQIKRPTIKWSTTVNNTLGHGLWTPNEAFFHWNPELLGLGRQIGQINSGAFGVFSAKLSAPILVQEVPCPCFPLFNHYFYKTLYPHPKYLFGIGRWIWAAKN